MLVSSPIGQLYLLVHSCSVNLLSYTDKLAYTLKNMVTEKILRE
jgi:hypothetical protein